MTRFQRVGVFVCLTCLYAAGCSSPPNVVGSDSGAGEGDATISPDAGENGPSEDAGANHDGGFSGADIGGLADAGDACAEVDCGQGSCSSESGAAMCVCDTGYHAESLTCVKDPCVGPDCPRPVSEWQALFDERWQDADEADCVARSTSGGNEQEHYFLAYCVDGLTAMWRASGDLQYLDTVLGLIDNTVDDTTLAADGYRRWPVEFALWESYYWRFVVTLLRVMQSHPDLLAMGDYGAKYAELLEFSEKHIWDKWEAGGLGNFYRSRTHMASHWARIGMELYLITGEEKYKEVFDNISYGMMVNRPSNLREQFMPNPAQPSAYYWASEWGVAPEDAMQDTSHAGAIVSFVENAAVHNLYWTDADITALRSTMMDVVWTPALDGDIATNVDGTGGTTPFGRLHEWLVIGRHDEAVQKRIEDVYVGRHLRYFGIQPIGIAALNAKILLDGAPAY